MGFIPPPCNNSHGKSSHFFNFRFSLFTPLLVLFLLIVGNSPAWAGCSFAQGKTIYLDCATSNWDQDNANFKAFFYSGSDMVSNVFMNKEEGHVFTVTIPIANSDKIKIERWSSDKSSYWGTQIELTAENAKENNCVYCTSYGKGEWRSHGSGSITTGCGGGDPEPEPYTGNLYLIGGACTGQNWVLNNATLLANNGNGIYTITRQINAVTGNSSDGFKFLESSADWNSQWRPVPTNATESLSDKGKAQNVTPGQENIVIKKNPGDPDTKWHLTESGTYTITIDLSDKNNGKMSIQAVSNAPHTGDKFYIMGSHNGWSKNSEDHKMTIVDGKYAYKTYENITENWDFKVAKEDGTELGWSYFSQSKSDYTCSEVAAAISNIRPNTYNGAKNLTIYWDGVNIYVKVENATPAVTYTVTLHPNNGGSNIVRTNVPEGSTTSAAELNLAAVTYGVGTATWYTDAACTTPFTTVTGDMELYAKWGVSGNYYFVSSLQTASDAGETGYWNSGWAKQLNYTSGNPGKCSYSFIAPAGRLPFELLTSTSGWNSIGADNNLINNDASNVTVAVLGGHFYFELPEPKKVTISYDGKVSVNVEDYNFDNTKTWHIKTSWASSGGGDWNYNTVLTNSTNGGSVVLPVQAGDRSFIISTKTNDPDAQQVVGTETFNALYVDTSNPSSGFNWRMTGAKLEGSGNFNKQLPQADGNYWRNCAFHVDANCDIRITFDGGYIRCDIVAPNIVTFKDGETTLSTQEVSSGNKATKPADPTKSGYTFVKWQLDGSEYDFSSPINSNITLNAVWAYKGIESVSLNESEHMTWVGNSDFTLTPSYSPSDVITKAVTWSSNNTSVATVNNGIVHAVGAGTATITCTVTDQYDTKKTATCEVTVAACEMATDNIYSMTVTGYNTSIGHSANLAGLWNESSDNTEPATFRIVKLKLNNNYYVYDDNGTVKMSTDASLAAAQWYEIPTGENFSPEWTGSSFALYEFKNVSTGKYLRRGNGQYGGNSDWYYYTTLADNRETDGNIYKFFYDNTAHTHLVCREGVNSTLRQSFAIHNNNRNWADGYTGYCAAPMVVCGYTNDPVNNAYTWLHETVVDDPSYANPNYKASQMNSSYYRMKENATVRANLANGLEYGSVITVRLYADAATSVKLQKTDGTEIETINLTADTEREYTYTGSALVGENAFVIKATDNHAGIASIVVTRTYAIRLAQLIEETEIGGTLTLTCDYATDNAVINKAITINGQGHTIGDLTVEYAGDLTLSSELTVRDFTIWAKAGNTEKAAASGQVRNASELNVNGNAYFLYTVDPSDQIHYGWYDFTVPFPINIVSGIKGIQGSELKEDFRNGVDYAVMEYFGDKQAQGQYPYKKFSGVMQPKKLYTITLSDYNTLRMQKTADGALVASESVTLNQYTGGDAINANWNGVGNGTLHHADAGISGNYIQVYQSGNRTFLTVDKNYSLVVGSAFMVQETGTMILNQANGNKQLLAPSRYESAPATAIQIASEGKPFSDQLFITASETGGQAYTPGVDVAKAGELGSANVPQIWTNAYNSSLCVHEAQLINGKAQYNLSIYAPVAGAYTLTSKNIPADYSLYLTQNGMIVSELSDTYTLDLSKGITTEYGLLLTEIYNSPTGIENTQTDKTQTTKIIRNGVLYILHNGKVYNAQGAKVK